MVTTKLVGIARVHAISQEISDLKSRFPGTLPIIFPGSISKESGEPLVGYYHVLSAHSTYSYCSRGLKCKNDTEVCYIPKILSILLLWETRVSFKLSRINGLLTHFLTLLYKPKNAKGPFLWPLSVWIDLDTQWTSSFWTA